MFGARWLEPEDYHVTLRFVGDVDARAAHDIAETLEEIRRPAAPVRFDGLSWFGGDKPRALVARIKPEPALMELQAEQERRLRRVGLPPETRKFMPHVTLARLRGVGFGGISVGGMVNNRKFFGSLLAGVDHLPATYNREQQAFTKGEPEWGGHLADALEGIVGLHDASTIAAVIVEPMAGSTGVLPPPKGYLRRLREICDKYGILLIFDEVITGFGRLGAPFAAERYGVIPDMITFAKGVTSGTVPMGGVIVRKGVHDAFMQGPEHAIELFHGYTYSGHPLACAAALAALDVYRDERLFERSKAIEPKWADAIMSLKGLPNVLDIRCVGLTGAIDLAPIAGSPTLRGYHVLEHSFHEAGIMVRISGDTIELTPPLIISESQIGEVMDKVAASIKAAA